MKMRNALWPKLDTAGLVVPKELISEVDPIMRKANERTADLVVPKELISEVDPIMRKANERTAEEFDVDEGPDI